MVDKLLLTDEEIAIAKDPLILEEQPDFRQYVRGVTDKDRQVAQAQLIKALKGKEAEIEQAVKQERERIIQRLRDLLSVTQNRDRHIGVRNCIKVIQALKEGKL